MTCQRCGAPLGIADRYCTVCSFPPAWPASAVPVPPAPLPPPELPPQRPLAGFLVSFQDDPVGKVWILRRGRNTIGRADTGREVDVSISSGTVGTFHATIDCDEHRFLLSDTRSPSGTLLNHEAIGYGGQRGVRHGDMVRFGGYDVMVISLLVRPWMGR